MSKIEQIIEEIEEYIENSKPQPLSQNKIIVNKDGLLDLLAELRLKTPEEIKKYQNIIKNRDEILNKAKADAEAMLAQTAIHTNELINEHEIMQQAFVKANEIIQDATNHAQHILDSATEDANNIRMGAIQYTDEMLSNMQNIIANTMENARVKYESFANSLNNTYEMIQHNRNELIPPEEEEPIPEYYEGEQQG